MNKLFILSGMVFLGITSTQQAQESGQYNYNEELIPVTLKVNPEGMSRENLNSMPCAEKDLASETELDIASIAYEVIEEPVDLGFDPEEYLPEGFDPEKVYVDLNAITFMEEKEEDLAEGVLKGLLPEGFDPYATPVNFMDISYMEEGAAGLGFNTSVWLPEGFDPYSKELDLDTIVYIEEEDLDLGFDTSIYLPDSFNPYSL